MKMPNSAPNLIRAIKRYCAEGQDDVRLARAMADVVVGQMLPDGVVKGGSSLMFRYGGGVTRYTKDVDTARVVDLDVYLESLRTKLAVGWNGFSGKLVDVEPPSPPGVPKPYLMMPYDIKLQYCGRAWMTVRIEIGHNEIGDADAFESKLPEDIAAAFATLLAGLFSFLRERGLLHCEKRAVFPARTDGGEIIQEGDQPSGSNACFRYHCTYQQLSVYGSSPQRVLHPAYQ